MYIKIINKGKAVIISIIGAEVTELSTGAYGLTLIGFNNLMIFINVSNSYDDAYALWEDLYEFGKADYTKYRAEVYVLTEEDAEQLWEDSGVETEAK